MAIDKKLIDQLLTDYKKPEDIIGENGLLKELTKAILERALQAEMTDHLGYEKHDPAGHLRGNSRNGKSQKTLKGDFGELELETPRDRKATFEPKIVAKGQTRWTGFDDKIISMYARGMTTREIQGHLEEMYGIEVSPTLISNVTDAVIEEVKLWQNRPLEELHPIVYLDALMVKVRDEGHIQNKAIYVVLGVNLEGQKEVLGLWVAQTEGAKFWLQVLTELQNRGVKDIFIACVDGLKGFPEAIEAVYPRTEVPALHRASGAGFAQLCALESTQAGGGGPAVDLPRGHSGRGRATPGAVGGQVESLSQREPGMAAELGAHHAVFQLPGRHPQGDLHHEQCGIAESVAAQDHQNPGRIPQPRRGVEVAVSRASASREEVDHADPSLAGSLEPLHDSVAGADAGPGESYTMNAHPASTVMGWGRGNAPFPSTPSPKTTLGCLHKTLDTPFRNRCSRRTPESFQLGKQFADALARGFVLSKPLRAFGTFASKFSLNSEESPQLSANRCHSLFVPCLVPSVHDRTLCWSLPSAFLTF